MLAGMSGRSVPVGDVRPLGDQALLVGVEDAAAARALASGLAGEVWATEVVSGRATVMVAFDPEETSPEVVQRTVARLLARPSPSASAPVGEHIIPTIFAGPDLTAVAEVCDWSVSEVIDHFTAAEFTVEFMGFAPGFGYLSGLPDALATVPRRASPRTSVPPGSVALAGGYAAVYPTASPGGWQLLGRTTVPLFDPAQPPYARFSPGDRVRFTVADDRTQARSPAATQAKSIAAPPPPVPPEGARPVLVVVEPGLRTVVQDGGRHGVASLGVPSAGPSDPLSLALANRLVGNAPDAGALEVTARGPRLRALCPLYVAVVGASPEVRVAGRSAPAGQVVPLSTGQELSVGALRDGLRTYVAVAGGFETALVLGGRSTDQLTGLGAGPLVRAQELWAGPARLPMGDHLDPDTHDETTVGSEVTLRVLPGPHPEWFVDDQLEQLAAGLFTVAPESNRVGLRLQGHRLTARRRVDAVGELDSQGVVTGTIQIPPSGDPVVLLGDHATLGGYPVLAVVVSADLGRLGQCGPGTLVRLLPVDPAEAAAARRRRGRVLDRAVRGHYPLAVD
jgi:KipI family sensor histidine kinase inhibitor